MSNLLEQASIVLSPTAYDDGKVLCVKPSEPPYGDFDFSRNSSATRVNAQGLVEDVQILSSDLVSNGDFSQIGTEETLNGDFSQIGTEEVSNGDFSNGSTDWTLGTGWSIGEDKAVAVSGTSSRLEQPISGLSGKTCKISFTLSDYGGGGAVYLDFGSVNSDLINTNGEHIVYGTFDQDKFEIFKGSGFSGLIDNISVKEVGQNWGFTSGAFLTDIGARLTHTPTAGVLTSDGYSPLVVGNNYKMTYEITQSISGGIKLNSAVDRTMVSTVGVHTKYFEADAVSIGFARTDNTANDVTIDNISVKEVGMDWTLSGVDFSLGSVFFNDASDNILQSKTFTVGSIYRLSFEGSGDLAYRTGFAGADATRKQINLPYTIDITATADTNRMQPYGADGNLEGTLTNISVIEITNDTNLPRISYENFSYQDALGSELVTNGDFANGSTDWTLSGEAEVTAQGGRIYSSSGSVSSLDQDNVMVIGNQYKLTFDVIATNGTKLSNPNSTNIYDTSTIGSKVFYITAQYETLYFKRFGGITDITIDNVSVKEYSGQEVVPNSGCGSLLFEPQSTNLITQSETFSDAIWTGGATNATVTASTNVNPSGNSGTYLVERVTGSQLGTAPSVTTGLSYTGSFYVRNVSGSGAITLRDVNSVSTPFTATDKWQRFSVTGVATGAGRLYLNVLNTGDIVEVWGAQLEQQSYATSYIPTEGTTVTRNQDLCTNGGDVSLISSTEGTLYAEINTLNQTGTFRQINLSNGTASSRIYISKRADNDLLEFRMENSLGSLNFGFNLDTTSNFVKVAFRYGVNNFAVFINGVNKNVSPTGNTFSFGTLNKLDFSSPLNQPFFGKTKCLAVWKESLSDTELTELTTI